MRARRHKDAGLLRHDVLLESGQELFGFGEGESQLLEPLAVFLQYRHFMDRVRSLIVRTNDQLHLYPHVAPSPVDLLIIELNLPSVRGYPQAFDALSAGRCAEQAMRSSAPLLCLGAKHEGVNGSGATRLLKHYKSPLPLWP